MIMKKKSLECGGLTPLWVPLERLLLAAGCRGMERTCRSPWGGSGGFRNLAKRAVATVVQALVIAGAAAQSVGDGVAVLPVDKIQRKVPVFYSTGVESLAVAGEDSVKTSMDATFRVHQGHPEQFVLGLNGEGTIRSVEGEFLRTWRVRREADGSGFLELELELPEPPVPAGHGWDPVEWSGPPFEFRVVPPESPDPGLREFSFKIQAETPRSGDAKRQPFDVLVPGPADAVGFSTRIRFSDFSTHLLKVLEVEGLDRLDESESGLAFAGDGDSRLRVRIVPQGARRAPLELVDPQLVGTVAEDGKSVGFRLTAQLRVGEEGARVELLSGASPNGATAGDNWHLELVKQGEEWASLLVAGDTRAEGSSLEVDFIVPVKRSKDRRVIDFKLPAGVVVPVRITGLDQDVSFDPSMPLVPRQRGGAWQGFLNASGDARLAWRESAAEEEGALFFTSTETSEVRVGAGLLRQNSLVSFRVLQGRIEALNLGIEGAGEVLSVAGDRVLGWSVAEDDQGARFLKLDLSRPIEGQGGVAIETQAAVGAFPVEVEPMRFTPEGALRHSGHVRVGNEGAVRLEVAGARGMMQLSPEQFPGGEPQRPLRQAVVYRFPSADYAYRVAADQVLPEVDVSEVTIHEMAESDRRITSDLNLDIREAPVREWEIGIPEDFAVAEVGGAKVADYSVASESVDGVRSLKVLFSEAVIGRQLVHLKLERNLAASEGEWVLPALVHPEANDRRGFLGVMTAPGYRVGVAGSGGLAETPVDYFPKQVEGLQQAFRIREESWSATMDVEALGQSVQADVFHLYSLKEGVAYGSVIVNYFVVGAPASEWRLRVPGGVGNIEVTGQNVGRDWRQEEDVLVVPMARPVMGLATILVTFEQPMSTKGGTISPGEWRPLGVQSERGYIQVTSPLQVKSTIENRSGSLLGIDASEIPLEYRNLTSAPTLAAWQYTSGDPAVTMQVEWYERGEPVGEVIEFSELDSRVSSDGQVVTTARMFARSRGGTTMKVRLPPGAVLWEAKVAGEPVNAREDGSDTLIPLDLAVGPNEPIEVVLRYGVAGEGSRVRLAAPASGVATAIARWTVRGDEGRRLVPRGGDADLVRPVMTETGFEWLATHGRSSAPVVLVFAALGLVLWRIRPIRVLGLVVMLGAVAWAFALAGQAGDLRRANLGVLEYSAPAVGPGEWVGIEVANVAPWQAMISEGGMMELVVALVLAGLVLFKQLGNERTRRWWLAGATALFGLGLLSQHGGAIFFFVVLGGVLLVAFALPWIAALIRDRNDRNDRRKRKLAGAATALVVGLSGLLGLAPGARAGEAMESVVQGWELGEGRLRSVVSVEVRAAEPGERFLLLRAPAVLTGFESDALRVEKEDGNYYVIANSSGLARASADYELAVLSPRNGWEVPTGNAVVQRIEASHREPGWEFDATPAARIEREARVVDGVERPLARIHLMPGSGARVKIRPKQRDASTEEVEFFAETSDLYLPGPGVVGGRHRIALRPSRGMIGEVVAVVPAGFTVSEVVGDPVGSWRFNPESRELRVAIEPAQESAFSIGVATERASETLPVSLELEPIRIRGAAGEVGMLALGFGSEAQLDSVEAEGMGAVNLDDFNHELLPRNAAGEALAVLQKAYRYGAGEASLELRVAPVAPEVRASVDQTLSLGVDRMVLVADMNVRITRAGVFRLELEVPLGFEVESVTGAALSHWTSSDADGRRIVTLHLNGRTLGDQDFALSLAAPSAGSRDDWEVPRLTLREATRQRGSLTVVPERGLQVRAVSRRNVSQLDPREAGVPRPGALAFRLLQADWSLVLSVRELDPWVTAQVLHELRVREGQRLTKAVLRYRIENAARKSLRVRLPGLDETARGTVRASGPAVGDFVPVDGGGGLWEIRFQRGVAGDTVVEIEFQQQGSDGGFSLAPIELVDVRQSAYFVALRTGGRLDASLSEVPGGWQRIDWSAVPAALRNGRDDAPPNFTLRVAESEGDLGVAVVRHDLADALRMRVRQGALATLVSSDGSAMTSASLMIETEGKGTVRMALPPRASLLNLVVNGEGVPLVREGEQWLFHVQPSAIGGGLAELRFTYSQADGTGGRLEGPRLDLPLERIDWEVFLPEGWELAGADGDFQLVGDEDLGALNLEEYLAFVARRRAENEQRQLEERDRGFAALQAGEQDKAAELLGKVARNGILDEASNEDARVQFRNLKMQQAMFGLNTRRQRVYLDNRYNNEGASNDLLEQAAGENPILQGEANWNPRDINRLMAGNTTEETSSLKDIAARIVTQQMEVASSPEALDVAILGQGKRLSFRRSLQVDGSQAMMLDLDLRREQPRGWGYGMVVVGLATAVLVVGLRKPRKEAKDGEE